MSPKELAAGTKSISRDLFRQAVWKIVNNDTVETVCYTRQGTLALLGRLRLTGSKLGSFLVTQNFLEGVLNRILLPGFELELINRQDKGFGIVDTWSNLFPLFFATVDANLQFLVSLMYTWRV